MLESKRLPREMIFGLEPRWLRERKALPLQSAIGQAPVEEPLVKVWVTQGDGKVRQSHIAANGQVRFLGEPFQVGHANLVSPRDPNGPIGETINCRCIMEVVPISQLPAVLLPQIENRLTEQQRQFLPKVRVAQVGTQFPDPHTKPKPPPKPITISGVSLPARAERILKEILLAAGETSARITDTTRTPEEQALVMYNNILLDGVKIVRDGYLNPGKQVVDVFVQNKNKSKKEIIQLMTQKINQIGPKKVSKHLDQTVFAFDVAPSSIKDHAAFKKAVLAHSEVIKFLFPPKDPRAFHIEINP